MIYFALEYPERVLSVIGIGSALGGSRGGLGSMTESVTAMERPPGRDLAEAKRIWIASPLFAPANRDPVIARRLREMVGDWSGWQLTNQPNHVDPNPPSADRIDRLSVPALVINGEQDNEVTRRIAVEIEKGTSAERPSSRRVRRRPTGDGEAPKAVNDLIAAFLAEQGAGPARPQPPERTGTGG